MLRFLFITLITLIFVLQISAIEEVGVSSRKISKAILVTEKITDEINSTYIVIEGGSRDNNSHKLPSFFERFNLNNENYEIAINNEVFEEVSDTISAFLLAENILDDISSDINVTQKIAYYRKQPYLSVSFIPFKKNPISGKIEQLVSFDFSLVKRINKLKPPLPKAYSFAQNSVLSNGTWYKLGVTSSGVYKISFDQLKNYGIDPSTINPKNIRLYGNGGGMLPFDNSSFRHDDLVENTRYIEGESDGVFDRTDFILFYGESQHVWQFSETDSTFKHKKNLFSDTTYYFLTIDNGEGKRLQSMESLSTFNETVTSFTDYAFYEKDEINLLKSGRNWYGEYFNIVTNHNFVFTFPNIDATYPSKITTSYAARSIENPSSFSVSINGSQNNTTQISSIVGNYDGEYAAAGIGKSSFTSSNAVLNVNINFKKGNSSSIGWLDYIALNVRRQLKMSGSQMIFRDNNSIASGNVKFILSNASSELSIWDITDPLNPAVQRGLLSGNTFEFIADNSNLSHYIAFYNTNFPTPIFHGMVQNQNIHALPQADYIIVAHPDYYPQALELADWHRLKDNMTVNVVTTTEVYNEFSSGSQDVTAIKMFLKMFYDKAGATSANAPHYLLLFGDGSYDNKRYLSPNASFVPTYQSIESLHASNSYTSDDYFGFLDDNESETLEDMVDVGIGRLPVKTTHEAQNMVNKVKSYYDNKTMKPWRNYVTFVGDDQDGNLHMDQSNKLAAIVESKNPNYNIEKIFFDAYLQQSSSGGQRYPAVNDALKRRIESGTLITSYTGHGGELGWAHERVLEIKDINSYTNKNNLTLMITATCQFSRYDDPFRTSAGELVILNPDGGAIGLLTTTRLVNAFDNFPVALAFFNNAFSPLPETGEMPRIGDLNRITKRFGPDNVNTRNFTLLGDPAVRLAYPTYSIETTFTPDTMKALGKVIVKGFVKDGNDQKVSDYNGIVYPIIFDKSAAIKTLGNDGGSKFNFNLQKNVLFKGKASVKNGDFEFTFIVPKDINYVNGNGKISYYSENGTMDANGYYSNFIIGGSDSASITDNNPPTIDLYMNNDKFVYGGVTNETPDIYAKLFDENGFNTTGNGVGHDIVAVLDKNSSEPIILNDYYESDLDSYQKGSIRYPFSKLEEGTHTLSLKAWDVYNNSGESETEFVVAKSASLAIDHILNYPNPFSTNTGFYFEHNQPGQNLDVSVQIFTVSGRIVKSIDTYEMSNGYRVGPINWNGLDDFGDKIGKGVYVYKLKVIAPTGETVNKYEKLVILN